MALATPPPPSAAATTSTARPLFPPNPRPHPPNYQVPQFYSNHHPIPPNSNNLLPSPHPHDNIIYPVGSSGRGFLPKHIPSLTLATPALSYHTSRPPFGFSHPDPDPDPDMVHQVMGGRPHTNAQPGGVMPCVFNGAAVSAASSHSQHKIIVSPNSKSVCNDHKDPREKGKDESALSTIRDRKVRISDTASLYALCWSWLRNGSPEESQIQYIDAARSLPRPLPLSAQDTASPVNKDDDKEEQEMRSLWSI